MSASVLQMAQVHWRVPVLLYLNFVLVDTVNVKVINVYINKALTTCAEMVYDMDINKALTTCADSV